MSTTDISQDYARAEQVSFSVKAQRGNVEMVISTPGTAALTWFVMDVRAAQQMAIELYVQTGFAQQYLVNKDLD